MKTKLALLATMSVMAHGITVPPNQQAILLPRHELERRLLREELNESMFSIFGYTAGTMYFRGRQDVLREMISFLDYRFPQDGGTPEELSEP